MSDHAGPGRSRRAAHLVRCAAGILAAGALGGCDLRFTDPYGQEPADLLADVRIVAGPPAEVRVTGTFLPGRTPSGRTREVADEGMELLGLRLEPREVMDDGRRSYLEEWTLPADDPVSPLRLRSPRAEGTGEIPATLTFGRCTRAEGEERRIVRGDTLAFSVACEGPSRGLRHVEWELEVRRRDTGGLVLAVRSAAPPPAEIPVLADWLEQPGDPELEATLTVFRIHVREAAGAGDTRVSLNVRWAFRWPIRWEEG